jgi:hypothetical protein
VTVLHWLLAVVATVARLFAGRAAIGQSQIWSAECVYALAVIIKKELGPDVSLYAFLQMLSVDSFEKGQLSSALQGGDAKNGNDHLEPDAKFKRRRFWLCRASASIGKQELVAARRARIRFLPRNPSPGVARD